MRLGHVDELTTYAAESLDLAREVGETRDVVLALISLGVGKYERGDFEAAVPLFDEALALANYADEKALAGIAISDLGDIALRQRNFARAIPLFEEALAISRETGNNDGVAIELYNLAHALLCVGRTDEAAATAAESLVLALRIENVGGLAWDLVLLGAVADARDDAEIGARLLGAAELLCEQSSLNLRGAEAELHSETAAAIEAELGRERYAAAVSEGRALSLDEAVECALSYLD